MGYGSEDPNTDTSQDQKSRPGTTTVVLMTKNSTTNKRHSGKKLSKCSQTEIFRIILFQLPFYFSRKITQLLHYPTSDFFIFLKCITGSVRRNYFTADPKAQVISWKDSRYLDKVFRHLGPAFRGVLFHNWNIREHLKKIPVWQKTESIEWLDSSLRRHTPPPLPSPSCLSFLRTSCVSPVELADGRGRGGRGAKSYDRVNS